MPATTIDVNDTKAFQLLDALASHKDTFLASLLKLHATAARTLQLDVREGFSECVFGCVDFLRAYFRHVLNSELSAAARDAILRTLLAVVRMGTFQALARQAADATAALQGQGVSSGNTSRGGAFTRRNLHSALMCCVLGTQISCRCLAVLTEFLKLVVEGGLPAAVAGSAWDGASGSRGGGGNKRPAQLLCLADFFGQYAPELLTALADSGVVEQQARLLMAVMPALSSSPPSAAMPIYTRLVEGNVNAWVGVVTSMSATTSLFNEHEAMKLLLPADDAAAVINRLHHIAARLITGPCVHYCTLSLGLAALRATDGGRSYGAPAELLAALWSSSCNAQSASGSGGAAGGSSAMAAAAGSAPWHLDADLGVELLVHTARLPRSADALEKDRCAQVSPQQDAQGRRQAAAADKLQLQSTALPLRATLDIGLRVGDLAAASAAYHAALRQGWSGWDADAEAEAAAGDAFAKAWAALGSAGSSCAEGQQWLPRAPVRGLLPAEGHVATGWHALMLTFSCLPDACNLDIPCSLGVVTRAPIAAAAADRLWRQLSLLLRHGLGGATLDVSARLQGLLDHGLRQVHTSLTSEAASWPKAAELLTEPSGSSQAARGSSGNGEAVAAGAAGSGTTTPAPALQREQEQREQRLVSPYCAGLRAGLRAGGLLPELVENAFRRAARDDPHGVYNGVADQLASFLHGRLEVLVWLLATAPAREAASLVATLGKVLRRANGKEMCTRPGSSTHAVQRLTLGALACCYSMARHTAAEATAHCAPALMPYAARAGTEGPSAAVDMAQESSACLRRVMTSERMVAVTALMVREWLPALAEHTRRSTRQFAACPCPSSTAEASPFCVNERCCLGWVTMLIEHGIRSGNGGGASSSGAAGGAIPSSTGAIPSSTGAIPSSTGAIPSSTGAGTRTSTPDGQEWDLDPEVRRFVLHDLCAAQQLQSGLRAHNAVRRGGADAAARAASAWLVAEACVAYAALAPEEWRAWVVAGDCEEPWVAYLEAVRDDVAANDLPSGVGRQCGEPFMKLVDWAKGMGSGDEAAWGGLVAEMRVAVWAGRAQWALALPGGRAVLLPLSEAGRALQLPRLCSNPACVVLEGDCEAERPLKACGGCGGAAVYCCRGCQVAHWRAGHKQACGPAP
ncbi:hypothetical protein CHLRE_07g338500v5 [Chlamydomonas reinhardtii]|uniref:MYND-type domain-containing protein n=1 Tax=Chlamydomonas reinhardtii TaxID=3055 RepID=A0A2K3DKE4_CHLRE|nr:uncharacterized protein CHLRE_07g338500v5 [Chlamydomonas reinhardtii]PNW80991.1 hypothetical protein CHLRE_07g338500v5 [Chlamydomonas reinhardtii]